MSDPEITPPMIPGLVSSLECPCVPDGMAIAQAKAYTIFVVSGNRRSTFSSVKASVWTWLRAMLYLTFNPIIKGLGGL